MLRHLLILTIFFLITLKVAIVDANILLEASYK
jgi:hypothetical protein